jgi:hypothetical protein
MACGLRFLDRSVSTDCTRCASRSAGGKHEKRQFRSVPLGHGRRGWCCTFANGTRYAESGLPESRTPANARFVFRTRSLHAPALAPTLLAARIASATAFRHCCRIVTKSTAKCGAFDLRFFASWRCVIVAFEGGSYAYHRPCGGSRCIMCIGRVFSLPHQPSLFGTTGSSTIEVGFNRQTRVRRG